MPENSRGLLTTDKKEKTAMTPQRINETDAEAIDAEA